MSVDDDDKEFGNLCQPLKDGQRTSKGDGEQGAPEEDDVRSSGRLEDVKHRQGGTAEGQAVLQIPQPQSQGAMVCWERFLHIRSLKVLLVEYDDSTRHVVTALLRNCSYEVIEAANGLQAWKILEDLSNHIDLVLTEVAMPCLSGIGLLCKIMNHKTRKNIPVIMMSSHDSMGLVFKCLSKGAVDFLVKPIRKNELKNLWQHVWRRCHSSSGSGSESGTQTQKSVKSKGLEKSENNSCSNDEEGDESTGLNVGDGSDNSSGTQSSWTKQAVEVDSPRPVSAWDHTTECPDSTCAQVVHSEAEISGNKMLPVATVKKCQDKKEQLELKELKELKAGGGKDLNLLDCRDEVSLKIAGAIHSGPRQIGSSKLNELNNREKLAINSENHPCNLTLRSKNTLMGGSTMNSDQKMHSAELEARNRLSKVSNVDDKPSNTGEGPSLELSLKRLRGVKDCGINIKEERNVLRRSDLSAFSRYNAAANKSTADYVGSNSPHCDSSRDMQSHSSGNNHLNQNSNWASNNIDMDSITNNANSRSALINKAAVASTTKCLDSTTAFQVVKNNTLSPTQQVVLQFHHHYDNHCHFPSNIHKMEHPGHSEVPLNNTPVAPNCGLSKALDVVEGYVGYSVNGSATGSNFGSNGQNGSSTALNAGGTNIESNNGIAGNSGSGDASGSGTNRVDQNKTSQREAALTKFRQKRKERCFRKKVRYQSRKRLAEQWPRFRGQFVRQSSNESGSKTSES